MAFLSWGEAFIEVISSNKTPHAGIFSSVVGNSSSEANNVDSTPRDFNPVATIFRTSSLSATTTHVAIPIDSYWRRVNSQPQKCRTASSGLLPEGDRRLKEKPLLKGTSTWPGCNNVTANQDPLREPILPDVPSQNNRYVSRALTSCASCCRLSRRVVEGRLATAMMLSAHRRLSLEPKHYCYARILKCGNASSISRLIARSFSSASIMFCCTWHQRLYPSLVFRFTSGTGGCA